MADESLPEPLTPPDCNLQSFPYMELDVARLRQSKFSATPNAEAFRAGVLLWCASWHQLPAASLPDDDVELADLAGYGKMPFSVKFWRKVRGEALNGFIKCSDGRLYHEVIAEKARAAWASRLEHSYEKLKGRLRKENKARQDDGLQPIAIPAFEDWIAAGRPERMPAELGGNSAGNPAPTKPPSAGIPPEDCWIGAGIPAENALRGEGEEKERRGKGRGIPENTGIPSDPGGSAGAAAPPESPPVPPPSPLPPAEIPPAPPPTRQLPADVTARDLVFHVGVPLLTTAGVAEKNARSMLASLSKLHGEQAVYAALELTAANGAGEPVSYLQRLLKGKGPANAQTQLEDRSAAAARAWAAKKPGDQP